MRLGALEHEPPDLARLVHEQHAVRLARDDRRVGDGQDRRRVDQHDVVLGADGAQELRHRRRGQQLGGVGRNRSRLDDVQVVEAGRGHDILHLEATHQDVGDAAHTVAPLGVAHEDVREARLALDAEEAIDRRPPHVGADEQGPLPVLGHREREVHDGRGLAFLQRGAGDDEHLAAALHPLELDVRTERAIGLGHRRLGIEVRDEQRVALQRVRVHVREVRASLDEALHRLARVDVRHDAEHAHAEVGLDVLDGADRSIERLAHEGQHDAEEQTEQRAHQHRVDHLRARRRGRVARRPHDRDLLDAFRLLDERLLVTRLEQRQQVVVHLGVALQPRQRQLGRGHLAVLREEVAHLATEDVLAVAQRGHLRGDLTAHLRADLAQAIVDRLQPRMAVGHLEGQVRALEHQLALRGRQLGEVGIAGVDVDALVGLRGAVARQPPLHRLELDPLLARALDVATDLREERQQHRRLGAGRDDVVGVAEGPHLLFRALHARVDLAQLGLDELARLSHPRVAVPLVVLAVDLGDGVGQVLGFAGIRGRDGDLDDARAGYARRPDLAAEVVERRLIGARLAQGLAARALGQLAEAARHLLEHRVALDQRHLRLDVVRAVEGQHLDQQPRQRGGLLELDGRRRGVERNFLPSETDAERGHEQRADDDDHPPAADDQPVIAQVHLVLRHAQSLTARPRRRSR